MVPQDLSAPGSKKLSLVGDAGGYRYRHRRGTDSLGIPTQDSVKGPGEEEESSPRKASGQNMLDVILAWVPGVLGAVRRDVDIGMRWRNFDRSGSVAGCPLSCWVTVLVRRRLACSDSIDGYVDGSLRVLRKQQAEKRA